MSIAVPLEPVAGDGVADRQHEEAKTCCQKNDVEHVLLLSNGPERARKK